MVVSERRRIMALIMASLMDMLYRLTLNSSFHFIFHYLSITPIYTPNMTAMGTLSVYGRGAGAIPLLGIQTGEA